MSGQYPESMNSGELAAELRRMAHAVERGDSLEGFIQYSLPEDEAAPRDSLDVIARYRIGNLAHGQGFMHIVGTFAPTSTTTTET